MLEKAESKLVTYEARTRGRNLVEVVIFFFKFAYLFRLCWVFIAACGLSLVAASRGCSSLCMDSRSTGFQ